MPTLSYSRQPGGRIQVEVVWQPGWNDTAIKFCGSKVAVVRTRAGLEASRKFPLPNGEVLTVRLPKRFMPLPEVLLDGELLRLYAQPPTMRVRGAFETVLLISVVNVVLGTLAVFSDVEFVSRFGASGRHLVYGIALLVLAWFVRRGSQLALAGAVTLFTLDGVAWAYFVHQSGARLPMMAVLLRVAFLVFMIRGFTGIRQIQANEKNVADRDA